MKTLLKWSIPLHEGQRALKDGSLCGTYKVICDEFTPDATYFYRENGRLAGTMILEISKASQIAEINRLLIDNLCAEVVVTPLAEAKDRQETRSLEFA